MFVWLVPVTAFFGDHSFVLQVSLTSNKFSMTQPHDKVR